MKADEKVKFEGEKKAEDFTNFELLRAKVEVLQEQIELIGDILDQNDLEKTTTESASIDVDDEAFKRLEEKL